MPAFEFVPLFTVLGGLKVKALLRWGILSTYCHLLIIHYQSNETFSCNSEVFVSDLLENVSCVLHTQQQVC